MIDGGPMHIASSQREHTQLVDEVIEDHAFGVALNPRNLILIKEL